MRSHRSVMIPAATTSDRTALVPTNPRVKSIAFRFGWKADTVVRRVQAVLPSVTEQQLYLHVASGYRIHPESLRKLLNVFLNGGTLTPQDLEQHVVGLNLVTSRFDQTVEKVEVALGIIDKTADVMQRSQMGMDVVAQLVEAYGVHADNIIGTIVDGVADVARLLRLEEYPVPMVIGIALSELCSRIDRGVLPLTVEEMFGTFAFVEFVPDLDVESLLSRDRRNFLHRMGVHCEGRSPL